MAAAIFIAVKATNSAFATTTVHFQVTGQKTHWFEKMGSLLVQMIEGESHLGLPKTLLCIQVY